MTARIAEYSFNVKKKRGKEIAKSRSILQH
jgi:hypothetical protein